MEIHEMTALELAGKIKARQISSPQVVTALLEKAEQTNPTLNAYISIQREEAIKNAHKIQSRIDAGENLSSLAGLPVSVKDNICTKGIPTTCGSKMLEGFTPPYNASAIEKLEAAGMIVIGKLNLDEFAMGGSNETSYFGKAKNPWDISRVPGGSSGGGAAAVAGGGALLAIGSDTGGSIRQPCAFCGISGIKPSYGSVSRYGLVAYASSLDQIGPMGKDIRDCAAALEILSGPDSRDSSCVIDAPFNFADTFSGEINGMTIGLPENYLGDGIHPDIRRAVLEAAKTFEAGGGVVETFTLPLSEYAVPAYYIIACAQASSNLSRYDGIKYGYRAEDAQSLAEVYLNSRSQGFGIEVKRRIMLGSFVLSSGYYDAYYNKALRVRGAIQTAFEDAFKKYDAILSPAAPTTAYKIGENISDPLTMYLGDIYTVSVNLAGLPALSIPCGFDSANLPIGMQLIGRQFGEQTILKLADAFQQRTDFHKRRCTL